MKRTLFKLLQLLIIGFPLATNAQVAPEVMKRFSGSVVSRVYSVTSKVNLTTQKQLLLAHSFQQQDSLADAALTKGLSAAEVSKNYQNTKGIYSHVLSPLELKDYLDADNYFLDAVSKAIKYRKDLNLNAEQTADLLKAEQTKNQLKGNDDFDAKKFENSNLIRILDKKYKPFLLIKNRDRASHEADENWKQLKKLNLTKGLDSAYVVNDMKGYINNRYSELEYAFDTGSQARVNVLQKKLDLDKPFILEKLDAYNGRVKQSLYATAIKFRTELKLTDGQINTLINNISNLQFIIDANKAKNPPVIIDSKKMEGTQLLKILNNNQCNDYWVVTNQNKARTNTGNNWEQLKGFNLVNSSDSIQINSLNFNYEINKLAMIDRLSYTLTPVNLDSLKRRVETTKPKILWKLDAYTKRLPRSKIAEVINYNSAIKLDNSQLDTLIDKIITIEQLKLSPKSQININQFESESIGKVLNYNQLNTFLANANHNKAIEDAKKDWTKWQQAGLTKNLDSTIINKENTVYRLNWLIANGRLSFNRSQANVIALKILENNKPQMLKQLDDAVKQVAVNKSLKNNLTF